MSGAQMTAFAGTGCPCPALESDDSDSVLPISVYGVLEN